MLKLFLILTSLCFSATEPLPIPRAATEYVTGPGFWEGGANTRTDLEDIELQYTPSRKREKWTIHFGSRVPKFRLELQQKDQTKLVLTLIGIDKNNLTIGRLDRLARNSALVERVTAYPQIEGGDMVVEWVLKNTFPYRAYQPKKHPKQLVFDFMEKMNPLN